MKKPTSLFLPLSELRKSTVGGARVGAGAKPKRGVRKQSLTIGVTPTLREFLDSHDESVSETIESMIRKSKQFATWEQSKKNAG